MINIYKNKSFFYKIIAFVLLFIFSCAIFSQNSGVYFSSEKLKALLNTTPYMEMSTLGIEIKEKNDLDNIGKETSLDDSYYLLGNLNLSFNNITPIGTSTNPFTGEFNGNGFSITIGGISSTSEYAGLFGYIKNAKIKNLTVILDSGITASNAKYVGGICGYAINTTFVNCTFVCGKIDLENNNLNYIGGICGYASGTSFTNCINNSSLDATGNLTNVGGICGFGGKVDNCINYGNIICDTSTTTYVGGIAGKVLSSLDNCYNNNCYNKGDIVITASGNTTVYAGGIVGKLGDDVNSVSSMANDGNIKIYSANNPVYVGGVIGYNECLSISVCANYGDIQIMRTSISDDPQKCCGGIVGYNYYSDITDVYAKNNIEVTITSSCYIGGIVGRSDFYTTLERTRAEVDIVMPIDRALTEDDIINCGNFVGYCNGHVIFDEESFVYHVNSVATYTNLDMLNWCSKTYDKKIYASCYPTFTKLAQKDLYDIGNKKKNLDKENRYIGKNESDERGYKDKAEFTLSREGESYSDSFTIRKSEDDFEILTEERDMWTSGGTYVYDYLYFNKYNSQGVSIGASSLSYISYALMDKINNTTQYYGGNSFKVMSAYTVYPFGKGSYPVGPQYIEIDPVNNFVMLFVDKKYAEYIDGISDFVTTAYNSESLSDSKSKYYLIGYSGLALYYNSSNKTISCYMPLIFAQPTTDMPLIVGTYTIFEETLSEMWGGGDTNGKYIDGDQSETKDDYTIKEKHFSSSWVKVGNKYYPKEMFMD